ncbi:alpha/beta fold hydrolase [Aureispira sp. CCB-QB1]|uniref:alpha/beta fold hydrolase n=1 Tax=Aureispira sp. CCB-QB1 TaxID=1313421 RepID=UPI00069680BC|nr:alpha/beta hydrolase [Aureispira sp. CCB-QB1]
MKKDLIKLNNYKLEYCLTGSKHSETILFVHGLGANQSQFEQQHIYFSAQYQVLSISLCGHGNSTVPLDILPENFSLTQLKNDLIQVLDLLKIAKVHYVGNSMGGNVGLEFLKESPNRLLSLTLFGTTGKLKKSRFLVACMKILYQILSIQIIANLSRLAGTTSFSQAKIATMISKASKKAILYCLPHLANFDYLMDIKNSKAPTLLLVGEKDKEINACLDSTIEAFQARGNFQLKSIKGAGHFINLDAPELFNRELEAFLQGRKLSSPKT